MTTVLRIALLGLCLISVGGLAPQPAFAATFTVNTINDAPDATIGDGICATSDGQCSLRAAIQEANAAPDNDIIQFADDVREPIVLDGTALLIESDLTLTADPRTAVIIDGADRSPVFSIAADATVQLRGLTIQNGRNPNEEGGGIVNAGTLTLLECIVQNNQATLSGGGIYNNGGTLTVRDTIIRANTSTVRDGAGIASSGGSVGIEASSLVENQADANGGGLFVAAGTLSLRDTLIEANRVLRGNSNQQRGGGIYFAGTQAVFERITVRGNRTGQTSGLGGGIYLDRNTTVQLTESSISNNTASGGLAKGGGLWNNGTLTITTTRIESNRADYQGGGLFSFGAGVITMNESTLSGNRADEGGGLFNDRDARLTISSSQLLNNIADTLDANGTSGDGGAIYNSNRAQLDLRASTIRGNTAAGDGGGIYNWGTLLAEQVLIERNQTVLTTNGQIIVDEDQDGGGIYSHENSRLTVRGSIIRDNEAGGYGGGIARRQIVAERAPSTILEDVLITGNTARGAANPPRPDGGGGLWLGASSTLISVTVSQNRAPVGGGILVTFDNSRFEQVQILENTAFVTQTTDFEPVPDPESGIGGGLSFAMEGSFRLDFAGGVIANNTAEAVGGGVYAAAPRLTLSNITISGNRAETNGAGLYKLRHGINVTGEPRVRLIHGTLRNNTTAAAEGTDGIFSEGGYMELANSILDNGDGTRNCNVLPRDRSVTSLGGNLERGASCAFAEQGQERDQSEVDPQLGALQDNGGNTLTHALQAGSPAIDAGISADELCAATDQRGVIRPQGSACDSGAYEFEGDSSTPTPTLTPTITGTTTTTPPITTTATITPTPTVPVSTTQTPTPTVPVAPTATVPAAPRELTLTGSGSGAPGSAFGFTGTDFTPNMSLTLTVNDIPLRDTTVLSSTADGRLAFAVQTDPDAQAGVYILMLRDASGRVQLQTALASGQYTLNAAQPIRTAPSNLTRVNVPPSIAPNNAAEVYLPLIVRRR
ncbi:MAG: CSLREA domain-containing protein [Chloroflexaceae bacterium]|nr:CSLREA domain-containing protein [Chloroflexaceae bacterium]